MSKITDPKYLRETQYKDASNLNARIALHQKFSTNPQGWNDWVFDRLLTLPVRANILELGCGSAALWKESAERIPAGWAVTLTDLSDGMLDAAWRNLIVTGRGFKFEKADAQSIPYADKTFDVVIANHVLYHVPDRKRALQEIRRVLKSDGVFFAATLGENHMREMWDVLERVSAAKRYTITSAFALQNGQEQLREFFSQVETFHYPDSLRVTDLSALMAYVRSMASAADLQDKAFKAIENEFAALLERDGAILIEKAAVLFKATQ